VSKFAATVAMLGTSAINKFNGQTGARLQFAPGSVALGNRASILICAQYSGHDAHRSAPQFGASELHGDEANRDNVAGIVRPHIARVRTVSGCRHDPPAGVNFRPLLGCCGHK
jgi:hypothetical protein